MLTQKRFNIAFRALFTSKSKKRKAGEPSPLKRQLPPALVACSGGVDSMVLLDLMRGLYRAADQESKLSVCYIDHRQRPDVTDDMQVVSEYCTRHHLQLAIRALDDVPQGASEEWLRAARYEALKSVAVDRTVFTAHHAQDQLETLLFRLIRGAHPSSLKGIPARAKHKNGVRLARPLLEFSKADTYDYARRKNLRWHEDSTNNSPKFARNRIRNELLPLLESFRPGTAGRLLAFFSALIEEQPARTKLRKAKIGRMKKQLQSGHGLPVLKSDFDTLKAAVDDILDQKSQRTTRAHWNSVKRQLQSRKVTRLGGGPKKILQFPGGHALCFQGNRVFWVKNS